MTDRQFTDDEIIKALECCNTPGSCFECPYYVTNEVEYDDSCVQKLIEDILPLINRQEAEIERLQADINSTCVFLKAQRKESEREHKTQMEMLNQIKEQIPLALERAKAEAIKEFAWRLKNRLTPYPEAPFCEMVGSLDIDALVEEMTEDNNESQNT